MHINLNCNTRMATLHLLWCFLQHLSKTVFNTADATYVLMLMFIHIMLLLFILERELENSLIGIDICLQ